MPLFEAAIILKSDEEKEQEEALLVPPTPILASDSQTAATRIILDKSEELKKEGLDLNRLDVLVRPFFR